MTSCHSDRYVAGSFVVITTSLSAQQANCGAGVASSSVGAAVTCCRSGPASADVAGSSRCFAFLDPADGGCLKQTYSNGYFNQGPGRNAELRASLADSCDRRTAFTVGTANMACDADPRKLLFNLTTYGESEREVWMMVGCQAPTPATSLPPTVTRPRGRTPRGGRHLLGAACYNFIRVPAPGPVSALQPRVVTDGLYTTTSWSYQLSPAANCDCRNIYWSIYALGTWPTAQTQCT